MQMSRDAADASNSGRRYRPALQAGAQHHMPTNAASLDGSIPMRDLTHLLRVQATAADLCHQLKRAEANQRLFRLSPLAEYLQSELELMPWSLEPMAARPSYGTPVPKGQVATSVPTSLCVSDRHSTAGLDGAKQAPAANGVHVSCQPVKHAGMPAERPVRTRAMRGRMPMIRAHVPCAAQCTWREPNREKEAREKQ